MKKLLCLMLVVAIGTIAQAQDNPKPSFGKKILSWAGKIFTKKEKPVATEEETKAVDAAKKKAEDEASKKAEDKELPKETGITPFEKDKSDKGDLPKPTGLSPEDRNKQQKKSDLPVGTSLAPYENKKIKKSALPIPTGLDPDYSTGGETKIVKEKSDSVNSANTDTVRQNYTSPGGQNENNQQTQTASNNPEQNKKPGYYKHLCKHNCCHPEHYEVQEVVVVGRPVRQRMIYYSGASNYRNYYGRNNCATYKKWSYSKPMKKAHYTSSNKTMAYNGPRRSGR